MAELDFAYMQLQAVAELVRRDRTGDATAGEELWAIVYDQLRRIAARHLRLERAGHTLAPTAVVHEAYLRLAGTELEWRDRAHFLAIASNVMRRVLVEHARARNRSKRGAGAVRVPLDDAYDVKAGGDATIIELDSALERLAKFDPRKARTVELVSFGGLSLDEAAQVLEISAATVHRDLRVAKAWLENELGGGSR